SATLGSDRRSEGRGGSDRIRPPGATERIAIVRVWWFSTGCAPKHASHPLFGFSSGRYPTFMQVQLTPRASRHAPRFPNSIREYRLKAGLSQRRLAAALGRGRNAVSSWERGLTLPSVPRLMRMAKVLGTLAESLYMKFYAPAEQEGEQANH